MTPRANRSLPPPFYEIGAVKFQELCADLMAEDQLYLNPVVYGRNGTSQRGIDIEAPLRDKTGLHVGQCKAWAEASAKAVQKATEEFLPHLKFWQDQELKKFILLIGCAVDDQKTQDQLREEAKRFKTEGVDYEFWDSRILRRKLRPYPHIVRNHCDQADYWVDFICGTGATSLEPATQAGLNAIVSRHGTLVLELSEARNKELAAILEVWEQGAAAEALTRVSAFSQMTSWSELTAEVRARSLRIEAALTLAVQGDIREARRLFEQVRILAPNSCMALEASLTRHESGATAALGIVGSPNSVDAWNVRLALLLETGKPDLVLAELSKVPVQDGKNTNTAWAEAMALLCLKRVEEARRVLADALRDHRQSLKLRMAMAMVRYASGVSCVFPAWGHLTWPVPPPWQLVKRDEESRKQRAQAAEEFGELANKLEGDERREVAVWRLACLANEPTQQLEAVALCKAVLSESPGYVPAVVWAQERDFEIAKPASILALRSRMAAASVQPDEIIALFSLVADTEGLPAAEKVLDDLREKFDSSGSLAVWRAHKVQCLVARGEVQSALKLVEDEIDPVRKRQVQHALLGAKARKDGDYSAFGSECEAEFKSTGAGDALFSACEARRVGKDWAFIADHAEELIRLVGTDAALRMGVEGAINGQRPEFVLKLLQEHAGLCPGGVLPPDLERVRAEALKRLGRLSEAVQVLEKAVGVSADTGAVMHLFRLKRSKGDILGSAETAKLFLKLPDVPAQFLTEEVIPAIRRVAPELTRELLEKARQSLPEDSPALLLVAQQASKLGLDRIASEVFGKMPLWAQKGVPGIIAVDVKQMTEMVRQQAESWAEAIQRYRQGLIPVHALAFHFNVLLSRWFLETPRMNAEDGFPFRCIPVLTRHGALANDPPVNLDPSKELFLDITSVLLLYGLNLLELVELAFPKIAVPARLPAWLQAEVDNLQPGQPELMAAQERALQLVDAKKVQVWSSSQSFSPPAEGWADKMGPRWCERLSQVKAVGGVFVDFLPVTANRPEMEHVVLPETEAGYVIGEKHIIASLESAGSISATEAANSYEKLGLRVSDNSSPRSIPLNSLMEVHLETGIAERLALVGLLKPLSEVARVLVDEIQVIQWRDSMPRHQLDVKLLPEVERLLAHISHKFDTKQYRGHECPKPLLPPEHPGPLSEKELSIQDSFDYAENGTGIWCNDDRFLRGLHRGPERPCVDTFDLVHHLHRIGQLDDEKFHDVLISLRAANLRYLPVTRGEILYHLRKAKIEQGDLLETRALKVLRRTVAAALMDAEWLQRPVETPDGQRLLLESEFPVRLYLSFASCFIEIWTDSASSPETRAVRSKWLWNQLCFDIRLMQQLFGAPDGGMSASEALGHSLGHLYGQGFAISGGQRGGGTRRAYFQWIFDYCLATHIPNNPEILKHVAASLRPTVTDTLQEMDKAEKSHGPKSVEFVSRMILIGEFLVDLPVPVLDALKLTPDELKRLGLAPAVAPFEVLGVGIEPSEFWPAVARALVRGYAAVLRPAVRVQMTRDDKTGRIWIRKKGHDARDGGYLNVPCFGLLAPGRAERIKALQSSASWFDLNAADRGKLYENLADIEKPVDRMQRLYGELDNSAAWFYRRFEERAKDPQARTQPLNISDLLPDDLECLRRHLRLAPSAGSVTEPIWDEAAKALPSDEGIEETLVRLSCLPVRLPSRVLDAVGALDTAEVSALITRLSGRMRSPLQRLQFLLIALKFGKDLSKAVPLVKWDFAKLLNPDTGIDAAACLIALVKWSHLRLGWSATARGWSPEARLRVAWIHAGRIHSALAAGGVSHREFKDWVTEQSQEISAGSFNPAKELELDAASPSGVNGAMLLMFALVDIIDQLPAEIVVQLELPALFKGLVPTEESLFSVLFPLWHDLDLRTNALGSFFGWINEGALRSFVGDAVFGLLTRTPPRSACENALAELLQNPHQPAPWSLIHLTTNGGPLPEPQAAMMDRITQRLQLPEALDRDPDEVQQLIVFASNFISRGRPPEVVEAFWTQLLNVAAKCSSKFGGTAVTPRGDNDASRIGAALIEATWECSLIQGDISGTVARFIQKLTILFARWPSIARSAHLALVGVTQRMPLEHQQSLWRGILSCRAWS